MDRSLEYAVVDAFADRSFNGNAAAVIFEAADLSDGEMASIAREFNLSETTFVLPPAEQGAAVRFRWFTPGAEVDMCGHATLAAVHALTEAGRFAMLRVDPDAILPIQTRGGRLLARTERAPGHSDNWLVWLDLCRPVLKTRALNMDKLARLLGLTIEAFDQALPVMQTQDDDVLLFVQDLPTLFSVMPSFGELADFQERQRIRGFCVATVNGLAPSVQVQSRFFCPALGVNEDPVTGSVHGPLATYLVINELVPMRQHVAAVSCIQASPAGRAGLVRALVTQKPGEGYDVRIGGQCITTMHGRLTF